MTNARAMQLETNPAGTAVTEVIVEHDGGDRDLPGRDRRRLLRRRQLGPPAAGVGQRQAPARPRQRLGSGGPQLHVPQQPGGPRRLEGAEPDPLPEDARAQRLLLRRAGLRLSRSATSRWSASRRRRCSGARSRSPSWRRCGRSRRWPSTPSTSGSRTEDLPRPENRVTLESDGSIRLSYTKTNQVPTKKLYEQLKSMLGQLGMHPEHLLPRNLYLKNEMDVGAVGASGGHLPLRHRSRRPRCST